MGRLLVSLSAGLLLLAAFPASTNYRLNSYSVGPAGTNNSHSTHYYTQSTGGEVSGNGTVSSHYAGSSGGVQTEQLAIPQAPTLSNSSGTYYNQLLVTLNDNAGTNSYPSDVTFSVAISTTNCFTSTCVTGGGVEFVQTGGTLGGSQFYQTYSAWGGSSGFNVTGLTSSTTYYVAVAAKQGSFTNTAYGTSASAATAAPSVTFSVSPNSIAFGNLTPGTMDTSSTITFGLASNAAYGATIYDSGLHGGLYSPSTGNTIPAKTANVASVRGMGLQGETVSQTSGGPLSILSPYNGTAGNVGIESVTYAPIFSSPAPLVGGSATMLIKVKANNVDDAAADYNETLTFVATAGF